MLTLESIFQAQNRLRPYVLHTPLLRLPSLDALLGCQVYVKAECMQLTHSFKIRGALNRILQLTPEERAKGVVTASSGNHGRGVAYGAKMLGIQATVVIPEHAPAIKIQAVRDLGANVILCEKPQRFAIAERLRDEQGLCYVPPFNDYDVMAGQGPLHWKSSKICRIRMEWLFLWAGAVLPAGLPRLSKASVRKPGSSPANRPGSLVSP